MGVNRLVAAMVPLAIALSIFLFPHETIGYAAQTNAYLYDTTTSLANDDGTIIFQISGRSVGNSFFDYMASHLPSIEGVSDSQGISIITTPGYCNGWTRRFSFTYHGMDYVIENCDYSGFEGIIDDSATLMNDRPEQILGHLDAISVKFCPYDSLERSVHSAQELQQILDQIRINWQNHNEDHNDNLNLVYWTLVPALHSQWHDPNDNTFPIVYHEPVNEHIKYALADPNSGIVSFDVWSRLVEGSSYPGFMNPTFAVSTSDNHLSDAGNDVLMRGFLFLLEEWFAVQIPLSEDINQDGRIDALDLQICANVLIGSEEDPIFSQRSDVNGDGSLDSKDIQQVIHAILHPTQ
jgi:hypothetical protein